MTATDAAYLVLRRAGTPLHYEGIVRRYERHYRRHYGAIVGKIKGKTTEATVAGRIGAEVRHRKERGDAQRFVLYGKGIIGLLEEFEKRLLKRAKEEETPDGFEMLVKRLLTAMGFEDVVKSRAVKDSGIDVRGTLVVGDVVRIRMAVQAKRFKGTVSSTLIQQLRGSLGAHEQGLVITTGRFSKQAKAEAARPDASPVALMAGGQLAMLLAKHKDALGFGDTT